MSANMAPGDTGTDSHVMLAPVGHTLPSMLNPFTAEATLSKAQGCKDY